MISLGLARRATVTGMSARHERHWDRLAGRYDEASAGVERRFLAPCRPWVTGRSHGRVLEVGVGTGTNLAHYPPDTDLTGIERSPAMLEQAVRRVHQLGPGWRAPALLVGDAEAIPAPDRSFDTVLCTFTLCCVPDERRALTEMARVLRPGGSLLLADHVLAERWWLRIAQSAAEVISVPVQGEHFRRRPVLALPGLGFEVTESRRSRSGVIECVHAHKSG